LNITVENVVKVAKC